MMYMYICEYIYIYIYNRIKKIKSNNPNIAERIRQVPAMRQRTAQIQDEKSRTRRRKRREEEMAATAAPVVAQ